MSCGVKKNTKEKGVGMFSIKKLKLKKGACGWIGNEKIVGTNFQCKIQ